MIRKFSLIIFSFLTFVAVDAQKIVIGSYTFKDGAVFTGEMLGNKPNGKGITVYPNGDKYEGEYKTGKRQGYGTFSVLLVIEPVAFIFLTVRERIGAVALAFPLFVFAFVLVSVRKQTEWQRHHGLS